MSVNAPIRICVLEGLYRDAQLLRANCPLSVAVEQWPLSRLCQVVDALLRRWVFGSIFLADTRSDVAMLQLPPNRAGVEGEGNQGPVLKLRVPTPSAMSSLTSVPNDILSQSTERLSLIDEHPSSQCTLVTPIRTTSSAVTEVDVPADVPDMEVDSAVPGTEDIAT